MCTKKSKSAVQAPAVAVAAPDAVKTDNQETNGGTKKDKKKGKRLLTVDPVAGANGGTGVNI